MRKILIIMLFAIMGCDYQSVMYVCDCEDNERISQFLDNNIEKANNMSDEEMEDVIYQLHESAVRMYCEQEIIIKNHGGSINWEKTNPPDSCRTLLY